MESRTIWTILRVVTVTAVLVRFAALARLRSGNRLSWSSALGALVCNAGKGLGA
jgi:hypothetical protein